MFSSLVLLQANWRGQERNKKKIIREQDLCLSASILAGKQILKPTSDVPDPCVTATLDHRLPALLSSYKFP